MGILIAEDSGQTSLILRNGVESLGHECVMAADGVEAWELFRQADARVVISDWLMPRMDGRELCRRIRESERPDTYFISLTNLDDKLHLLEGERAGADGYLTKPVHVDELRAALARAEEQLRVPNQPLSVDAEARWALVEQLAKMGPRLSTRVLVNGRSLTIDAAIRPIERLSPDASIGDVGRTSGSRRTRSSRTAARAGPRAAATCSGTGTSTRIRPRRSGSCEKGSAPSSATPGGGRCSVDATDARRARDAGRSGC